MFKTFSDCFAEHSKAVLFVDPFLVFMFHVYLCYAVLSVPCSLAVTCWERADLLAVLCCVFLCFCDFLCCLDPHQNLG